MTAGLRRASLWAARACVIAALAAGVGLYRARRGNTRLTLPTAPARQGDFLVLVRCRGALKARRSAGIYAPTVPGLRIAWVAHPGDAVSAGDVILRFDSSSAQSQLLQKEAQLKQSQASLDQAVAQSKITAQQDQTELADARFSVESSQWQVKQQEILSRIKGAQAQIDLSIAEQRLKVQEATVALHNASDASRIASLTRQRDQVLADVQITRSRIVQMDLKAPIGGLFMLDTNCSGAFSTSDCKPFKAGDNVSSNMSLGQIPDLSTLEMDVKLEEADRGRAFAGQEAIVRVDALPELTLPARVNIVSSLAEMRMEYPYTRSFRAYAAVLHPDPRLRPDMNGGMDIVVNRIPNAVAIPSAALFTRSGKPVVYLAEAGGARPVEVQVQARNPDEVAVLGIPAGSTVSLVDPASGGEKK